MSGGGHFLGHGHQNLPGQQALFPQFLNSCGRALAPHASFLMEKKAFSTLYKLGQDALEMFAVKSSFFAL